MRAATVGEMRLCHTGAIGNHTDVVAGRGRLVAPKAARFTNDAER